jgi:hypothetical protein
MTAIFIDPSYPVFNKNKLFDLGDDVLNRDNQLMPFFRLREKLSESGISLNTADMITTNATLLDQSSSYISLGILQNYRQIAVQGDIWLKSFVIMEPPVVAPELYRELPELTNAFSTVYVHNIEGHGYSLGGVSTEKLRKFYWPIPFDKVIDHCWGRVDRAKRIAVINGSHKPRSLNQELYSTRIKAMSELAPIKVIDLYGRGWDRWWSSEARWIPYWRHRKMIMSIYKGPCNSKYEVLKNYEFCLCFENMRMNGYVTEKIFDCLYAGTIPLYLGAPDINLYIPDNVFIDCTKFNSWAEVWGHIQGMTADQIMGMRNAGRNFIEGKYAKPFFESLRTVALE